MPHRRKPFIDKKHATTYRLIPGFVPDASEEQSVCITTEEKEKRKEEQRKYGVFFDDEYDYMQHMRDLSEGATLVKVSDLNNPDDEMKSSYGGSVNFRLFSSPDKEQKEEHIDADILASLDEAPVVKINDEGEIEMDDEENFLEDDFISKAGGFEPKARKDHAIPSILEDQDLGSDFDDYSDEGDFNSFDDEDFDDESYEAHLSRGRGNAQDDVIEAQTALILKNFEEGLGFSCMAQQMDDDDGIATTEDIEHLKEILMQDKLKETKQMTASEFLDDHASRPQIDTSRYLHEEEEEFVWKEVPPRKPKFDCVSILSLNSNTRNLPTDIIPPGSQRKKLKDMSTSETEPSIERGLTRKELEEEIRLSKKADKASTFRPQDETADEKKSRKKAIKEERKERRQEKKANKIVFSMEKKHMDREAASASKSVKGTKIS